MVRWWRSECEVNFFEHAFEHDDHRFQVTCSFGVVSIDINSESTAPEALIASADSGLYQAKANGRNRVEIVDVVSNT